LIFSGCCLSYNNTNERTNLQKHNLSFRVNLQYITFKNISSFNFIKTIYWIIKITNPLSLKIANHWEWQYWNFVGVFVQYLIVLEFVFFDFLSLVKS
jgi:hypothetical protein